MVVQLDRRLPTPVQVVQAICAYISRLLYPLGLRCTFAVAPCSLL